MSPGSSAIRCTGWATASGPVTARPIERNPPDLGVPGLATPMVVPTARGLRFVTDEEPGIRRTGVQALSVCRRSDDVVPVTDAETLARIRSIAVPPAWTDVWISADPDGHVQATGRDARGRSSTATTPSSVRNASARSSTTSLRSVSRSAACGARWTKTWRRRLDLRKGRGAGRFAPRVHAHTRRQRVLRGRERDVRAHDTALTTRDGARLDGAHQVLRQGRPPARGRRDRSAARTIGALRARTSRPAAVPVGGRRRRAPAGDVDGGQRLLAPKHRTRCDREDVPHVGATLLAAAGFAALSAADDDPPAQRRHQGGR